MQATSKAELREQLSAAASEWIRTKGHTRPDKRIRTRPTGQFVYVIGAVRHHMENHPVKVGISGDVSRRLHSIQTGSPVDLKVYYHVRCPEGRAREIESQCHELLKDHAIRGEWFKCSPREALHLAETLAFQAVHGRGVSRFKGVRPDLKHGWVAEVVVKGNLQVHPAKSEIAAAEKYDLLARRHFKMHATTNKNLGLYDLD